MWILRKVSSLQLSGEKNLVLLSYGHPCGRGMKLVPVIWGRTPPAEEGQTGPDGADEQSALSLGPGPTELAKVKDGGFLHPVASEGTKDGIQHDC